MVMEQDNRDIYTEGLVTVSDAAEFLGISRSSLYGLMDAGQLIYAKIGKSRRIPKLALIRLAQANQQGGWKYSEAQ